MSTATPRLAIHYSAVAMELLGASRIAADAFKLPAWPDLVDEVCARHPAYVHLPLRAGPGTGDAIDAETGRVADWARVEALLRRSATPYVNVHLAPTPGDHPGVPLDSADPAYVERVATALIRDVASVVARFGRERVIVENDHDNGGGHLRAGFLPATIARVVAETGCGFLLDLAHARLAAQHLGMPVADYLHALPLARVRELHVSGVRLFDANWVERLRLAGIPAATIARFAGRLMDHLPMTEDDWALLDEALTQIRRGVWGEPWVVAFEYSGIGPLWEAVTDTAILVEQVRRLRDAVRP